MPGRLRQPGRWHVVLQIGKYTDPDELGDIPANVEVHSWVPQLTVLEQADAFVTHAGMGGSSEGLYTGVPMIAVPQAAEQFMNADRLVGLGVARRIDTAQATAVALRTALTELVADEDVARRSAQLRAEARAEGGTARAAASSRRCWADPCPQAGLEHRGGRRTLGVVRRADVGGDGQQLRCLRRRPAARPVR